MKNKHTMLWKIKHPPSQVFTQPMGQAFLSPHKIQERVEQRVGEIKEN